MFNYYNEEAYKSPTLTRELSRNVSRIIFATAEKLKPPDPISRDGSTRGFSRGANSRHV